jgi:hypothetical protein
MLCYTCHLCIYLVILQNNTPLSTAAANTKPQLKTAPRLFTAEYFQLSKKYEFGGGGHYKPQYSMDMNG